MSSALNESVALQCSTVMSSVAYNCPRLLRQSNPVSSAGNAVDIRNDIMFNFYTRLVHIYLSLILL